MLYSFVCAELGQTLIKLVQTGIALQAAVRVHLYIIVIVIQIVNLFMSLP